MAQTSADPRGDNDQAKTALVTGAAGGLGLEIVRGLRGAGWQIFATGRTSEAGRSIDARLPNEGPGLASVTFASADLASSEAICNLTAKVSEWAPAGLRCLIHVAGTGAHAPIESLRHSDITSAFAANATGPMLLTSLLLPSLRQAQGARVIFVSSVLGNRTMAHTSSYSASKSALNSFARTLRIEEAPNRLTVSVVAPGAIETDFLRNTRHPATKAFFDQRRLERLDPTEVARWVRMIADSPPDTSIDYVEISPRDQVL